MSFKWMVPLLVLVSSSCSAFVDRYPPDPVLANECAAKLGGYDIYDRSMPTIVVHTEDWWDDELRVWLQGLYDPRTDTIEYTNNSNAFETLVHEFAHRQGANEAQAQRLEKRYRECLS